MSPPSHLGNAESSGMMQLFLPNYPPLRVGVPMSGNYLTTLFVACYIAAIVVSDPRNGMINRDQRSRINQIDEGSG